MIAPIEATFPPPPPSPFIPPLTGTCVFFTIGTTLVPIFTCNGLGAVGGAGRATPAVAFAFFLPFVWAPPAAQQPQGSHVQHEEAMHAQHEEAMGPLAGSIRTAHTQRRFSRKEATEGVCAITDLYRRLLVVTWQEHDSGSYSETLAKVRRLLGSVASALHSHLTPLSGPEGPAAPSRLKPSHGQQPHHPHHCCSKSLMTCHQHIAML